MLSSLPLLLAWAAVLSSSAGASHTPRTGSAFVPQSAHFLPHSVRGATCSSPAPRAEARLRVGAAPRVVRQGLTSPKMSQVPPRKIGAGGFLLGMARIWGRFRLLRVSPADEGPERGAQRWNVARILSSSGWVMCSWADPDDDSPG